MKKPPAYDGTQTCLDPRPDAAAAFAGRAGAPSDAAKQLCATCAFLTPCRTYALSEDVHGVWGGMTGDERRQERVSRGLPEPTPVGDELDLLVLGWRRNIPVRSAARRPRTAAA